MSTNFNTIFDDLKTSFKLAQGKVLSYFLANLGMLILVGILFGIVAIPAVLIAFVLAGNNWHAFDGLAIYAEANPWLFGGMGLLILIPIVSLFLVVVGSIYGMSKELVATGDTKAELAFTYFKNKFFSYAGAGVLLTTIIIVPMLALWGSVGILNGYIMTQELSTLLSVITFVWAFFTIGLCANVFPAISYGSGVIDAFKESFDLAIQRFDRVYGLLSAFVLLGALTFGPVILWGVSYAAMLPPLTPVITPLMALVMFWTVISAFLWIFLLLPMTIIAWVKSYADMTGKEIASPPTPEIPIV
jgi:hypothetical protein